MIKGRPRKREVTSVDVEKSIQSWMAKSLRKTRWWKKNGMYKDLYGHTWTVAARPCGDHFHYYLISSDGSTIAEAQLGRPIYKGWTYVGQATDM